MDFNGVVLPVVVSDCLGDFVEPELLLSDVISPSLEGHVVGSNALSDSVEWELRDKVEWSVDMETKLFIQSLGLSLCLFVKIKYLPSLVSTVVSVMNLNCLTFLVFTLNNIEAFVGLLNVAEVLSLVHKDLEPL